MDAYLDYLRERIEKLRPNSVKDVQYALAEYNRALDFARSNNLTSK